MAMSKRTDIFGTDIEIFEFAIARELEANVLYTLLEDKVEDPLLKSVFEQFAQEELGHKEKLELEIIKQGRTVSTIEPRASEFQEVELQQDIEYKDVLAFAIGKERQAFRIYVDLSQIVRDPASRETLLSLAEEEARHMARFEIEYERLLGEQ